MPIGLLLCVFLFGAFAPAAAAWTPEKAAEAAQAVERFLKGGDGRETRPAAISVAIGLDGEMVLAAGFGQASPRRFASGDTIYRIGSITKQFTAAAILRLIEERAVAGAMGARLDLETPVSDIFDGAENWTLAGHPPITLRRLLNMNSSLPNFTRRPPGGADPWGAIPAPSLLSALKKLSPSGWPNTFEYSNTSYFLLAEAIEACRIPGRGSRLDYREFVRSDVFDKAGMASTWFFGEPLDGGLDIAAPAYTRRPAFQDGDWLKGSGDIVSTATDVFRWNKALMEGGILSPAMREEMLAEGARVTPTLFYGMGWFVERHGKWDKYSHSGSVPGYTSLNVIVRHTESKRWASVTLLTNSDGVTGLDELAADLVYIATGE